MALSEGTKIGPYEVIGLIGQGGMGEVWQARDTGSRTALEAAPPQPNPSGEECDVLTVGRNRNIGGHLGYE